MAVFKQGKVWIAQVEFGRTLDGKRDRRTKSCKSQAAARKEELRLLIERDGFRGRSNRITFADFVAEYYLKPKEQVLRPSTMKMYRSVIRTHLMPRFANQVLPAITRLQVQKMISECPTHKTARNARDVLRQILGEALQLELLTVNVAAGRFNFPEQVEKYKDSTWATSFAEHRQIIEAAEGDVRTILVLGFCFGLRKGEILGNDWIDIDFARKVDHIVRTFPQGSKEPEPPKTRNSRRDVPMTEFAIRELKAIRGDVLRTGPILVHNGKRMRTNYACKIFREFFDAHPEFPSMSIFDLRHSFATASIMAGVDVATVSRWLGHCDISTTLNRYVKPLQVDIQAATSVIDRAYG